MDMRPDFLDGRFDPLERFVAILLGLRLHLLVDDERIANLLCLLLCGVAGRDGPADHKDPYGDHPVDRREPPVDALMPVVASFLIDHRVISLLEPWPGD